ncbi:MAG: hypothetical protein KDK44_03570 [Chlamydiia bacterium]|nr:hypothetical protein [Chlamydiia bacterium]
MSSINRTATSSAVTSPATHSAEIQQVEFTSSGQFRVTYGDSSVQELPHDRINAILVQCFGLDQKAGQSEFADCALAQFVVSCNDENLYEEYDKCPKSTPKTISYVRLNGTTSKEVNAFQFYEMVVADLGTYEYQIQALNQSLKAAIDGRMFSS